MCCIKITFLSNARDTWFRPQTRNIEERGKVHSADHFYYRFCLVPGSWLARRLGCLR